MQAACAPYASLESCSGLSACEVRTCEVRKGRCARDLVPPAERSIDSPGPRIACPTAMILVTGATGTVGLPLVRALRKAGQPVRALLRQKRRAEFLEKLGVEIFAGDLAAPESYREALNGVDRAFILTPSVPAQAEMEIRFIDGAIAAGISLLVKHSAVGAEPNAVGALSAHSQVERYLQDKHVPHVVVRPTQFMQDLLRWAPSIAGAHALVIPLVDESVRVNLVDVRDVVDVEVEALMQSKHIGHTYIAAGPELLTYEEIVERLSKGVGSSISLRVLPADRYRGEARAAGYASGPVDRLVDYFSTLRTGHTALAVTSGDVATITGHAPRSVEQFAHDNAAALYQPRPEATSWMG